MLGRDRVFKFKALKDEITSRISALLVKRAARPAVTSVAPPTEDAPAFEAPVKHLRRFGGSIGALKFYPHQLVYESVDTPSDSRHWRYGDIQNISQSERYCFEIATFEDGIGGPKTYNFQLREALPPQAYDYAWARVYPSKFHGREESSRQVGRSATPSGRQPRKQ